MLPLTNYGTLTKARERNLLIAKAKLCRCQAFCVSQYLAKSTQTELNKK